MRQRLVRRARFEVQAFPYSCGPIGVRNAWIWQHEFADDPLVPCPWTERELMTICKTTEEDGTLHENLCTNCLDKGGHQSVVSRITSLKMLHGWLHHGGGAIVNYSIRDKDDPGTALYHTVFVCNDSVSRSLRVYNDLDKRERYVHQNYEHSLIFYLWYQFVDKLTAACDCSNYIAPTTWLVSRPQDTTPQVWIKKCGP